MARNFRPIVPFSCAMKLLIPTYQTVKGVRQKIYPDPTKDDGGIRINGSFRTFNGTETTSNDTVTVVDTATIQTWYRPDIKSDCRIWICETGFTYDIIGDPEDINMRHQYVQMRVQKTGGKA